MRFINVLLALMVILFSLAGAEAIGADTERNHASGKFAVEVDGLEKGKVKSVEDGKATAENAKKRAATTTQTKSPQATTPPRAAVSTAQPLCSTPPCIQKNEVDTKKK